MQVETANRLFPWRCTAAALALTLVACNSQKLVHVPAPLDQTDVFAQESASKIDLLWVIDSSGSMAPYIDRVSASLENFIDVFSQGAVDYRIAVTTLDMVTLAPGCRGTLYGTPQIISSLDDDPLAEFQQNIQVGVTGSAHDEGLYAMQATLENLQDAGAPILAMRQSCEAACNGDTACIASCDAANEPSFLRPDAYLAVVVVTNGEDKSEGDQIYYARWLQTLKGLGNALEAQVSTICGDVANPSCPDAIEGTKYIEVAQLTGGVVGSICDSTFDQDLTNLANVTVNLKRHFILGKLPQANSLSVVVNYRCDTPHDDPVLASCQSINDTCTASSTPDMLGIVCTPNQAMQVPVDTDHPEGFTEGWSYQCTDNSLYFHADATGDSVPGVRSQVSATYLPAASGVANCSN